MWTRSAKKAGGFTVECKDWNGELFFQSAFPTAHEADRAGEDAERRMTMKMMTPAGSPTLDEIMMSDDELLAELLA